MQDLSSATLSCYHCGLPVPPGESSEVVIDGAARPMCCPGCAAAASLIIASGLDRYYRYRTETAERVDLERRGKEYLVYDDAELQRGFVSHDADGAACAQLAIDGIRCTACVWLLEHFLEQQPGVRAVNVNFAEQRAAVDFDAQQTSPGRLMAAIADLGYTPTPYRPGRRDSDTRRESRAYLLRLGVSGLVMMQTGMFAIGLYAGAFQGISDNYRDLLRGASLLLSIPVVFYAAQPFFVGAWRGLRAGHPGMDVPVALAIGLAFLASCFNTWRGAGEVYFDSVAMFTFFLLIARFLEVRARQVAGLRDRQLSATLPDIAQRIDSDGQVQAVSALGLKPGERILIRQGERVPADAVVVDGRSGVDESAITGESQPVRRGVGDALTAGTLNVEAPLEARVTAVGMDSRIGSIMRLVDRAFAERPPIVTLADRVARRFVVVVLLLAVAVAVYWTLRDSNETLAIVLSVLVVSCPCALSLATPVALTVATTALKHHGLLVTRGHVLEKLPQATTVLLDKTGTLTEATLSLQELRSLRTDKDPEALLDIAAAIEARSEHPLASAFRGRTGPLPPLQSWRNVPARGLEARIDGRRYRIGSAAFVAELAGQEAPTVPGAGRWLLLGDQDGPLLWIRLGDPLRPSAAAMVAQLKALGLRTVLLSGDRHSEVARVAAEVAVDDFRAEATPESKLEMLRELQARGERVIMVGDGINDLPVQAGADVSVAVAEAADIGKARADCLLLSGRLTLLADAIRKARQTRRIVRQNLGWALSYNLTAIPFAAIGLVPPWLAAIGMSASSLVVVGNARRLRRWKASIS